MKYKNSADTNQADLKEFKAGGRVWVRNYRSGQKWIQDEIIGKIGQAMYHVKGKERNLEETCTSVKTRQITI